MHARRDRGGPNISVRARVLIPEKKGEKIERERIRVGGRRTDVKARDFSRRTDGAAAAFTCEVLRTPKDVREVFDISAAAVGIRDVSGRRR